MAANGFDAKNIGDMAEVSDSKTLRPPPQNNSVNSSEMVSFLEELRENYDTQLSDDDKDSILAAENLFCCCLKRCDLASENLCSASIPHMNNNLYFMSHL